MLGKNLKIQLIVWLVVTLSACSKTFEVVSEVPTPLIEQSAISAKLNYSAEFKAYEFLENDKKRALEKVSFGNAQVDLFDRIFGSLFKLVSGDSQHADLKIEPRVLDFQYAVPAETKSTQFEIWLKYRLIVSDSQDQEIADWVVKGYGKTPTAMLNSHLKSFNTAANIALRDVGAQLAIGFRNQPSIKDYLAGRNSASKNAEVKDEESLQQTSSTDESSVEVATGSGSEQQDSESVSEAEQ